MSIVNNSLAYSGESLIYNNECELLWPEYTPDPRFLTLTQSQGGIITANKLSGFDGETVTLSNIPSTDYSFSSYLITGAELTGSQFNFAGYDVTAEGIFKSDVLASGNFVANTKHYVIINPNNPSLVYYYCSTEQTASPGKVYVTAEDCPSWIENHLNNYFYLVPTGYFSDMGGAGTASQKQPTAMHVTDYSIMYDWMHLTANTTETNFYICQYDYFGNFATIGNYIVK